MKRLIVYIIVLFSILCCGVITSKHERTHFATGYSDINQIECIKDDNNSYLIKLFRGRKSVPYGVEDSFRTLEEYNKIAIEYEDIYFPKEIIEWHSIHGLEKKQFFLRSQVISFNIISDISWGDQYPAGSSLNTEFVFLTKDYDDNLKPPSERNNSRQKIKVLTKNKSLQKLAEQLNTKMSKDDPYKVLWRKLSDIDFSTKKYLKVKNGYLAYLYSDNEKMKEKQTLTISLSCKNGEEFSTTIKID